MGVAGSGKTTVAAELARQLGWQLAEADEFHSKANVEKMRAGIPLTDEDRWPWLDAIARWIDAARRAGKPAVVTCSGLKRAYRDRIVGGRDDVRLVYLKGDRALVERRMAARTGHYMPPSLLQSQLDTLEPPAADEQAVALDIGPPPEQLVKAALTALQALQPA